MQTKLPAMKSLLAPVVRGTVALTNQVANVPDDSVVGGVPGRVLKTLDDQ